MTTAHRATFHAAIGGKEQGGGRYIAGVSRVHVHDLAGQMSIKTRQPGQGTADEISKEDMRAKLQEREHEHLKRIGKAPVTKAPPPLPPPEDDDDDDDGPGVILDPDDADDKRAHAPSEMLKAAEESDDDDDDDDEDDEEELMRELERIKQERAQEALKREQEEAENELKERDSAILQGNPLLDPTRVGSSSGGGSFAVKRRWDDDVVFKNQAREPKKEGRRFINDTVRNDFHRKFLSKYIK
jgi:protein CWC15